MSDNHFISEGGDPIPGVAMDAEGGWRWRRANPEDEKAALRAWLEEEVRALSGEPSAQPMRLPPVVRAWMLGCMDVDNMCRQVDAQRAQLHRQLGVI